ncbi:Mbeg1-like protein [Paenibacillus bouchesdurhonensis]|uniref:Mbeg1-like protein n=1 Tax=Paenibacillus bouchesdurhonensis TaxID=1870990 RepID=UPI000DA63A59|nr:Mbeg1-like protein [Paenibacillus bouchesdurhonensis]
MAELEENQLLLLNNLIYLQGVADSNDKKVGDIVDSFLYSNGLDKSRNLSKIGTDDEYPSKMSKEEWLVILRAIEKDPQLRSLKVTDGRTGAMVDQSGKTIRGSDGKPLEAGMRAATFVDPQGDATVVFRGTGGDYEWHDNGQGGYLSDTQQQKAALDYIESLKYDDITVTGHSKGGNKTQYVAILSDKVDRALSFDGQGFSKEFLEKYKDQIAANAHKITSISAKDDFVNCLLNPIAGTIKYIDTEKQEQFIYNHRPNIVLDEKGQMRELTERGDIPKFINDFTIYINETMEEPYRSYALDGVLAHMESGAEGFEKEGDFQKWVGTVMVLSHLDDYAFNKIAEEYGDEAELVVTFIAASLFPYLFADDFLKSLGKNIMNAINYAMDKLNQFGDWIVKQLTIAAAKLVKAGKMVAEAFTRFVEQVKIEWGKFKERAKEFAKDVVITGVKAAQAIERFKEKLRNAVTSFFKSVAEKTKKILTAIKQAWDKTVNNVSKGVSTAVTKAKSEISKSYKAFKSNVKLLAQLPKRAAGLITAKKSSGKNKSYRNKIIKGYSSHTSVRLAVDFGRLNHLKLKFKNFENYLGSRVQQMVTQAERVASSTGRAYSESNVQRQVHQVHRACEQVRQRHKKVASELQSKAKFLTHAEEQYRRIEQMIKKDVSTGVSF